MKKSCRKKILDIILNSNLIYFSISSSRISDSGSPEQQVPNLSTSNVGSPGRPLGSTLGSSAFSFRPVRHMSGHDQNSHLPNMPEPAEMSVTNSTEENNVSMDRGESNNHGNLLNVSMDDTPSNSSFNNSGNGRPTQV